MSEQEQLAALIYRSSGSQFFPTICAFVADNIIASPWLAARDARIRAETLNEAARWLEEDWQLIDAEQKHLIRIPAVVKAMRKVVRQIRTLADRAKEEIL
ncbi:hypothetical protein [Psychromicrobium lacuslunae]|uniref:Uncharacterized protein n=1 Tax=Psychromicrobium lacuslunae TaxID=1618207 RepID=A0A0D4C1D3_9MICC|nr:hypothetical protein [Psychromicrobium lacuslunae]AJT42403.1 hypothetical protein UM93_14500 [Psychromicrobium lacuslunae]